MTFAHSIVSSHQNIAYKPIKFTIVKSKYDIIYGIYEQVHEYN